MPQWEEDTERPLPIANIKLFSVRSVFSLGLCVNCVSFFNISHEAPDTAASQRSHRRSRVNVKEWEGDTHTSDVHVVSQLSITVAGGNEGGGELSWAGATGSQGHVLVSSPSLPAATSCFQQLINDAYLVAASCRLWSLQSSEPSVHHLWAAHQVANEKFHPAVYDLHLRFPGGAAVLSGIQFEPFRFLELIFVISYFSLQFLVGLLVQPRQCCVFSVQLWGNSCFFSCTWRLVVF